MGTKNAFDVLISRLDMAEERISEPEDITTDRNLQTKKQKINKWRRRTETLRVPFVPEPGKCSRVCGI